MDDEREQPQRPRQEADRSALADVFARLDEPKQPIRLSTAEWAGKVLWLVAFALFLLLFLVVR